MALDSNIIANRARAEKAAKDAVKGEGINPTYVSNVVDVDPIDYVEGTGVPYGQKTTSDNLIQRLVWNDETEVWDNLGEPLPNKAYVDDEISAKIALEKASLQAEIDADILVEKNRAETAEANLQTQVDAIEDAQLTGLIAVGTKTELDAITDKDDLTPGRVDSDTDYSFTFTDADITAGADTIGKTAVSLSDNDVVIIFPVSGTLDSALTAFENYYVVSKATDSIKLSLTPGGSAIDLQGDGSGTYTLVKNNNGDYRWDGGNSYWIKKRGVYSDVLDVNGVIKAPTEKAVADHITGKVIGSKPVASPEDGFKFFSKLHRKFLTWSGTDWRDEQGTKVHVPFIYRNGANGITKTVDDIVTDWADVYDVNTTTVDDADGQSSGVNGALPEWQDAVVNSLPAVYFDGTDRFLSVSRKGLTECTVYAVVKMQSETEETRLIDFWDDGSAEGGAHALQIQIDRDLEHLYGFARDTGGNFSYTRGKFNDWCVIGLRGKSGEFIQSFLNSAFGDRIVIEDFDGVSSNNSWIIGANRDHDENFFKGWLAEFVMFDNLIGNDEHNLIVNSLLEKYGLTPTKEGHPWAGQSQVMGRGDSASSPAVTSGTAYEYEGDVATGYSESELSDPVTGLFENSDTGSAMPAFVNALYGLIKKPIYIIPAGDGGTALTIAADSGNGNWNKDDDTLFQKTCEAINSFIHDGGILRAIHWIQGERDAQYLDTLSSAALITAQQNYRLALPELINNFREYYPNIPFIITQTGRLTSGDTTGFQFVRQVQKDVAQQLPNVYLDYENAVNFEDLSWMDVDGIHWNQDGLNDIGEKKGIFTFNVVYK